ncbi:MAG: SDR family oxidoreductase, partial [Acidobacteria bacterium]|nr:SDR family oxidoreductase [Acidobacteriota bacterium]
ATSLAEVADTLQTGRAALPVRVAVAGPDASTVAAALRAATPVSAASGQRPLVWQCPGQGVDLQGVAAALADEPFARAELDACAAAVRAGHDEFDLWKVLTGERIAPADVQVALVAVTLALAAQWRAWGMTPSAVMGHSVGELSAAAIAGVLPREAALELAIVRGRLMASMPPGGMLAVAADAAAIAPHLEPEVVLAALNGPSQSIVSGAHAALDTLEAALASQGLLTQRLATSGAFHSPLMAPVSAPLAAYAATLPHASPQLPWISSVTGRVMTAIDAAYWGEQVTAPVRWTAALATARALSPAPVVWLEVGPGHTLTSLARAAAPAGELAVASMGTPVAARLAPSLAQLWQAGLALDWTGGRAPSVRRRVVLPTYPFQRQRYWIEPLGDDAAEGSDASSSKSRSKRSDIGRWFYAPAWTRLPIDPGAPRPSKGTRTLLVLADSCGVADRAIDAARAAGDAVVRVDRGRAFAAHDASGYTLDPANRAHYTDLAAALAAAGRVPTHVLHCWSIRGSNDAPAPSAGIDVTAALSVLSLAHALHAIRRLDAGDVRLVVATCHTQDVAGDEAIDPRAASVQGIARVLRQELPGTGCRTVDLPLDASGAEASAAARHLYAELGAEDAEVAVAYRRGVRWVERFAPRPLPAAGLEPHLLRARGTYLITGGLGRIGLAIARFLARSSGARLVLTSRTPFPPPARWAGWVDAHGVEDPTSRRIGRLEELETLGAEVIVVAADVADAADLRRVVGLAEARFGALHGVFHAAGVTSGRTFAPLADLGREALEEQFAPKAGGVAALADVLEGRALDFCVLLSSLSTVLGGHGFGAYAAANAVVDAAACAQARRGGTPWISVASDGWAFDEGGAPGGATARLAMTPAEGVETIARVLGAAPAPRIIVSTGDLQARLAQWVTGRDEGGGRPAVEPVPAPRTAGSDYVAPRTETERVCAAIWSELLGIGLLGVHDDFFELGGHSLLGTRLLSRVREAFAVDLSLGDLFAAPTVAGLGARIDARRAGRRPLDATTDVEVLLERVRSMSPEDRRRRLALARQAKEVAG